MTQTERNIITRCQRGDKDAFRWVVQTYQRMIFSLALKMLCDEEEAKDMVQEVFIRVWQRIRELDQQKNICTWIYTIASRLFIDKLRRTNRIVTMPEDKLVLRRLYADNDNQQILENRDWVSIVKTLVESLSEKQQIVFTLCQLEGLSSEEAGEIAGLDAKQIKSNLYVARQTIRKRLKELGYE